MPVRTRGVFFELCSMTEKRFKDLSYGVVVLPVFVQCRGSVSITADVEGGQVRNRRYSERRNEYLN